MLDAYIIDAIKQEELRREQAFEGRRIRLELPIPMYDIDRRPRAPVPEEDEEMNGPIIIPFNPGGDDDAEEDAA